MNVKKIRDPVYGYIEIDEKFVHDIVDTAVFQRLRNIRQTSYSPLYPASLHNRFVHSLGVYHLGKIAFEAIYQSAQNHKNTSKNLLNTLFDLFNEKEWLHYRWLFELACLLHDVGHSPFSHTGEDFYITSRSKVEIEDWGSEPSQSHEAHSNKYKYENHLSQLTKDKVFISSAAADPAPHEIMSCIVALNEFGSFFSDDNDKSFFARCITGLIFSEAYQLAPEKYQTMTCTEHDSIKKKALLNCFIQLLHSTVIDVDRLDYIIRDANTMGYQSVSIDYERLIKGMVIILEDDFNFSVGFHKNAISVIENAVYAHDNERKWVQGHPTILYESFLVQQAIIDIEKKINTSNPDAQSTLFSFDSLTQEGSDFNGIKVRCLGDEDILYLMKNIYVSKYSNEYFDRKARRLPVWKSEAEFKSLFNVSDRELISSAMKTIMIEDKTKRGVEVNEQILQDVENEIVEAEKYDLKNKAHTSFKKKRYFESLLNVCTSHGIRPDVVLLSTSFFKSNFSKGNVQKLFIQFPHNIRRLQEVSTTLSSTASPDDKFIFLYYYPKQNREKVDAKSFADALVSEFHRIQGL